MRKVVTFLLSKLIMGKNFKMKTLKALVINLE